MNHRAADDPIASAPAQPAAALVSGTGTPNPGKRPTTRRPTVLFIGTSLTAGYGVQPAEAFPAIVQHLADSSALPIAVVNAGVSGETSSDALHRIRWVLRTPADIIVLETGANDALRALPVPAASANIAGIVDHIRKAKPGIPILLLQMEAPPNLGQVYGTAFHALYGDVASSHGAILAPFFLEGVAGHPDLNQADGIHPNPAGAKIVARNVWYALEPVVRSFKEDH